MDDDSDDFGRGNNPFKIQINPRIESSNFDGEEKTINMVDLGKSRSGSKLEVEKAQKRTHSVPFDTNLTSIRTIEDGSNTKRSVLVGSKSSRIKLSATAKNQMGQLSSKRSSKILGPLKDTRPTHQPTESLPTLNFKNFGNPRGLRLKTEPSKFQATFMKNLSQLDKETGIELMEVSVDEEAKNPMKPSKKVPSTLSLSSLNQQSRPELIGTCF